MGAWDWAELIVLAAIPNPASLMVDVPSFDVSYPFFGMDCIYNLGPESRSENT